LIMDKFYEYERPARPEFKVENEVKWAMMNYSEIVAANLLPEVKAHLTTFKNTYDADIYRMYLRDFCGFPRDFAPDLIPVVRPEKPA